MTGTPALSAFLPLRLTSELQATRKLQNARAVGLSGHVPEVRVSARGASVEATPQRTVENVEGIGLESEVKPLRKLELLSQADILVVPGKSSHRQGAGSVAERKRQGLRECRSVQVSVGTRNRR